MFEFYLKAQFFPFIVPTLPRKTDTTVSQLGPHSQFIARTLSAYRHTLKFRACYHPEETIFLNIANVQHRRIRKPKTTLWKNVSSHMLKSAGVAKPGDGGTRKKTPSLKVNVSKFW